MDKCLPAPPGTHASRDLDTLGSHILLPGHPVSTSAKEKARKWLRLCQGIQTPAAITAFPGGSEVTEQEEHFLLCTT